MEFPIQCFVAWLDGPEAADNKISQPQLSEQLLEIMERQHLEEVDRSIVTRQEQPKYEQKVATSIRFWISFQRLGIGKCVRCIAVPCPQPDGECRVIKNWTFNARNMENASL